jgi:hypothetical protein
LKSAEEIMNILDAYDLTRSYRDAGELAGCSHHTVKHYVVKREAAGRLDQVAARPQLIDPFLPELEELVERSKGKIRADVAHEKLLALAYAGSERTTRRAVAEVRNRLRTHWAARGWGPSASRKGSASGDPCARQGPPARKRFLLRSPRRWGPGNRCTSPTKTRQSIALPAGRPSMQGDLDQRPSLVRWDA